MGPPRVVVGIDGSVTSFGALDVAAAEARLRTADLEVITCAGDPDEAGPVLRAAVARVARRHPAVSVTAAPVAGDPACVLAERGRRAALTVVGSRDVGGVAGLLLHSVSRRLAALTVAPLLVVRGADTLPARRQRAGGLLLGLESDGDADAALFAFEEAELHGARVDVLHTWTYRQTPFGELPPCQTGPHPAVNSRTIRSTPYRALIAATAEADMVVIGAHLRPGRTGPEPGPVAQALLRHAHCPVAIVPTPPGSCRR
ncbi:universal stress protein [Actinacidiphila bryophytorum]|uniref:Nucleotide-binding universal stress protein, UspA family n=1 Tax=Actinacidiphila bryophytorum TaxID=1436133 RepID=A0A9W4H2Y1_9ACTN|nr:universal stress protein [Actinacidiphila bryophytorum]MBM9437070.1 universal stress protein [Actinacidiphila bryophytorum]MBN6544166.1 universal stress protein [Actinacidiphila bryophytorum]CAG7646490.1 Nucleotide-binding universal stress protein, UspA family [Actinacidiphila bryophytorum]